MLLKTKLKIGGPKALSPVLISIEKSIFLSMRSWQIVRRLSINWSGLYYKYELVRYSLFYSWSKMFPSNISILVTITFILLFLLDNVKEMNQ